MIYMSYVFYKSLKNHLNCLKYYNFCFKMFEAFFANKTMENSIQFIKMEYLIYKDRNIETKCLNNMLKKPGFLKTKKKWTFRIRTKFNKIKR